MPTAKKEKEVAKKQRATRIPPIADTANTAEEAYSAPAQIDDTLDDAINDDIAMENHNQCTCTCGCHNGLINTEENDLLPSDDVEILAAFFKALSDPTRLNIVCVLLKYHTLSVGDIVSKTNMSFSAVSHQLAVLRMRKLVTVKRDGVKNYYALCDDHVSKVIEMAIEHIHED